MCSSLSAVLARIASLALAALAGAGQAQSLGDWWSTPGEDGWGMNMSQQGIAPNRTVFAAWFVYDASRSPFWVTATLQENPAVPGSFAGQIFRTAGPSFATAPFDSAQVTASPAGTATIVFAASGSASLQYTLDATTVARTLERFTFRELPAAGTYLASQSVQFYDCPGSPLDGQTSFRTTQVSVFKSGALTGPFSLTFELGAGAACTLSGTYRQRGSLLDASGTLSCSDGASGTWSLAGTAFSELGFVGTLLSEQTDAAGCKTRARIAGARLL